MFGLGFYELLAILIVVLLVFGAGKLPQLGSSLGQAIRDFKKGLSGSESPDSVEAEAKSKHPDSKENPR